jgi:4-amino-4-deoxy-L-arabinose transferase-like glycosyltransferase
MGALTWLGRLRTSTFVAGVALIVGLEAAACLLLSVEGRHHVLGAIDAVLYDRYAHNLVDHGVFSQAGAAPFSPSVFRTPGYPAFLTLLNLVSGSSLVFVRVVQFALVGITGLLVYQAAARVSGPIVGRISALICVTYLPLLWFAREHLTDILATTLVAAIVLLLVQAMLPEAKRNLVRFAVIGILVAAASLVRPEIALSVALLAACVIVWPGAMSRGAAAKGAGVMLVAFVVALAPWAIRNYSVTDRFVPLGTASGGSLYASALQWNGTISPAFTLADFRRDIALTNKLIRPVQRRVAARHLSAAKTEVEVNSALERAARDEASELSASDIIKRLPKRLAYLWAPGDEPPLGAYDVWHQIGRIQYILLVALVVVGLIRASRDAGRRMLYWPFLVFAVYFTAVHMVWGVTARYTMPARPLLFVFATIGFVWLVGWVGGRLSRARHRSRRENVADTV